MILCGISDTHSLHSQMLPIPDCDVLIHAGDFSNLGKKGEVGAFLDWFSEQKPRYKLLICGNHELGVYNDQHWFEEVVKAWFPNIAYLKDSAVVIDGIKFYGSPWTPTFYDWGFMRPRASEAMEAICGAIPDDTDVLITHGPPLGVSDYVSRGENVGEPYLMEAVKRVKPKYHIFGHIHHHYGMHFSDDAPDTAFVNVAICDEDYKPTRAPVLLDI